MEEPLPAQVPVSREILAKHLFLRAVVAEAQGKSVTLSPAFARELVFSLLRDR